MFIFSFQVFVRRIVQLRAEIEDGRDLVLALCKQFMPARQWKLIAEDFQGDAERQERDDNDTDDSDARRFGFLTGFDFDPSVRFFGIDWESIFGRCFSLSLNVKIFGDQLVDVATLASQERRRSVDDFDLVLINRILRDLASLEADVTAHAEAVLQGRLSKSQRKLIQKEQLKYSSTPFSSTAHRLTSKPSTKVSKSRSFRDGNNGSAKARQAVKYRKNRTTNLDKLSAGISPDSVECRYCDVDGRSSVDDDTSSSGDEQVPIL
jgi:hypothetical protein